MQLKVKNYSLSEVDIFPNSEIINQHIEKLQELSITDAVLGECIWHPDLEVNHLMDHITEHGCEQFSFKHFPKHGFTDFRHFYTCNISLDREFILSENIIFDESFYKVNFEDVELGYRLAKKGMQIYYYPEASGDHYHPYYDIKKFCNRQETAGEMALVLKKLHAELEPIIDVDNIMLKWSQYLQNNDTKNGKNLYDEIIAYCQYIEDNFNTHQSNLSKDLSVVYAKLFTFAYEKGICQQNINITNQYLNRLFVNEFFSDKLHKSLKSLHLHCSVPNYENIVSMTNMPAKAKTLLTIEAVDSEHLIDLVDRYSDFKEVLRFSIKSETPVDGLVYRPEKGFYIQKNNMRQILFFLQTHIDLVVIFLSFGLYDLPDIGIADSVKNSLITSQKSICNHNLIDLKSDSKGKIIRVFEDFGSDKVNFQTLVNNKVGFFDDYGYFAKTKFDIEKTQCHSYLFDAGSHNKPVVFVFPIFLAVGGVERNTIEIINHLKKEYDFVCISFERLQEAQGSLHHQFLDSCIGLYDLTELSKHDQILTYLKILNEAYNPQLVWICNGSPWLAANTMGIRNILKDSAIVDQEVYDTEEGWVQLYKRKDAGLLSFDRFIAINSKIRDVFVNTVGIDNKNVDLIYSVMSAEKRSRAVENQKAALFEKFHLNSEQKYIVFIGRLTQQKAPVDLLKLIRSIVKKHGTVYKFILVGSGELDDKITKFIVDNNLSDHIIRFEYIENTFEISMLAEAIIFTSLYEGLSIALLEALSVGTPGISTDVGDTKLILDKYGNGITFKTIGNIDEYLSTFEDFIANYDFYKENAEKNKNEIAERFSTEHISTQYSKCFETAIMQKSGLSQ